MVELVFVVWSPSLLAMSASDQIRGFVVTALPVVDALVLGGR